MMYNKVLDYLRGRESPPDFLIYKHVDRRAMARLLKQAEVFDFGELGLEYDETEEEYFLPVLTEDEKEFFDEKLIPVPAPLCWYEFTTGGIPSGLLVKDNFETMRVDLAGGTRKFGYVDGIWVMPEERGSYRVWGDPDYMKSIIDEFGSDAFQNNNAGTVPMVRYLTLMINSRSTDRVRIPADVGVNGELRARNRHGIPDHTVVTIIPQRYIDEAVREGRGTHASPRLHWRRSHTRKFRAPSGAIYHRVVIPRHLVGLASKGTVTHTYRVKHDDTKAT